MDRFIANKKYILNIPKYNLKSNMDRFIVSTVALNAAVTLEFKIQYGQIYRCEFYNISADYILFKIQYGQIYRSDDLLIVCDDILFKIQYGQIYRVDYNAMWKITNDLKSNMDRFIGVARQR